MSSALGPGDLLGDYPDVDRHSCRLLGPTALIVQGLMGILVVLSLVFKRHRETPVRPWRIWMFDVSKQVVGQMFIHGTNVLISGIIASLTTTNACVFYFLNILVDTTLGVGLIYYILHAFNDLLTNRLQLKGFESGQYGSPPSFNFWIRQCSIYVLTLTMMKMIVIGIFALFPIVFKLGEWLLSWTYTGEGEALQVIFTMGLFPIVMNVLQFWLVDSIVKGYGKNSAVALPSGSREPSFDDRNRDQEPLFNSNIDDDEEDDEMDETHEESRYDIENPRPPHRNNGNANANANANANEADTISTNQNTHSDSNGHQRSSSSHSYPPSVASSSASRQKPDRKTKRRSPPPPLNFSVAGHPALNSPAVADALPPPKANAANAAKALDGEGGEEEWGNAWGEDDWEESEPGNLGEKSAMKDAWLSSTTAV